MQKVMAFPECTQLQTTVGKVAGKLAGADCPTVTATAKQVYGETVPSTCCAGVRAMVEAVRPPPPSPFSHPTQSNETLNTLSCLRTDVRVSNRVSVRVSCMSAVDAGVSLRAGARAMGPASEQGSGVCVPQTCVCTSRVPGRDSGVGLAQRLREGRGGLHGQGCSCDANFRLLLATVNGFSSASQGADVINGSESTGCSLSPSHFILLNLVWPAEVIKHQDLLLS